MIKFEHIKVMGLDAAIRGMRNPLESWELSDSYNHYTTDHYIIGARDSNLMQRLCIAGSDHRKFMRMIDVTMDITAPLYWWKQFDTYKVGAVANSCSTMHTLHKRPITEDDFSLEHIDNNDVLLFEQEEHGITEFKKFDYSKNSVSDTTIGVTAMGVMQLVIEVLNHFREAFNDHGYKEDWDLMISMLPECFNQKRTVKLNYEVIRRMVLARRDHKLDEWKHFCETMINTLPESMLFTEKEKL